MAGIEQPLTIAPVQLRRLKPTFGKTGTNSPTSALAELQSFRRAEPRRRTTRTATPYPRPFLVALPPGDRRDNGRYRRNEAHRRLSTAHQLITVRSHRPLIETLTRFFR